jgi:hypothetical protein
VGTAVGVGDGATGVFDGSRVAVWVGAGVAVGVAGSEVLNPAGLAVVVGAVAGIAASGGWQPVRRIAISKVRIKCFLIILTPFTLPCWIVRFGKAHA